MAYRRAALSAAKRLARHARGLSALPRSAGATDIAAGEFCGLQALPGQLAFTRGFAAAAEPAAAPAEGLGYVSQVSSALQLRAWGDACRLSSSPVQPLKKARGLRALYTIFQCLRTGGPPSLPGTCTRIPRAMHRALEPAWISCAGSRVTPVPRSAGDWRRGGRAL